MNSVKGFLLCALLLCGVVVLGAQAPEWEWAVSAGGTSNDSGWSIAIDSQGNQYVTGSFQGTATFGTYTLTSSGERDIFAAKLDVSGNFIWAVSAGGQYVDIGYGIAVDSAGHAYLTGHFEGMATFGSHNIIASSADIFAAKLDTAGNWLWAVNAGGPSSDWGYDIAADGEGNAYLTGVIYGTATFGTHTLISSGQYDIFAAKLDTAGNWLWAVKAGGTLGDWGYGIAVDELGNACLTGLFQGTASFGAHILTTSGAGDIFAAKLDPTGNWLWAVKAGGTGFNGGRSIAVDAAGNACLTGSFQGTASFGIHSITSSGDSDIFAAKLDPTGNWLWAVKAGGTGVDMGRSIAMDAAGNAYLSGDFEWTATFGAHILTSNGDYDSFVARLDPAGNWLWAVSAGGTGYDPGYGIAADAAGNACLTGKFVGTASFGAHSLISYGNNDIFIARLPAESPYADFRAGILSGLEPLTVQFIDRSIAGAFPIINWFWTFGDGNSSNQQNPLHTYTTPGTYTVCLTVMDQDSQASTMVRSDYITVIELVNAVDLLSGEHNSFGTVTLEEQSAWQAVVLANTGNVDLTLSEAHFLGEPLHFELSEPFAGLVIPAGEVDSLLVRFVPQAVGALSDTLFIVNNSANNPVIKIRLNGTGMYVPPKAPENVLIVMDGNNAVISWDEVTENIHDQPMTPDYYFIFNSNDPMDGFTYQGSTDGLQYIHPMVGAFQPMMFYRVVAYKYYGRGAFDHSSLGLVPGMPEEQVHNILGSVNELKR